MNGEAWCEPCGNHMLDTGKGNKGIALVVLIAGLAIFVGVVVVQVLFMERYFIWSTALVIVPFAAAWPIAYPPTTGDKPIIVDRRSRRVPLPPMR